MVGNKSVSEAISLSATAFAVYKRLQKMSLGNDLVVGRILNMINPLFRKLLNFSNGYNPLH
jgi:hypothetical protein